MPDIPYFIIGIILFFSGFVADVSGQNATFLERLHRKDETIFLKSKIYRTVFCNLHCRL